MTWNTAHLFAGVGGGMLGDVLVGGRPVVAVEQQPIRADVLRMQRDEWWPECDVVCGDVRDWVAQAWAGRVDAVHAGFPCQDISLAGRGAGIHGVRSGLVWAALEAIAAIHPHVVFLENSPAIRSRGRSEIVAALVAQGYSWIDGVLAASDLGVPQRRARWWLLAADADGKRGLRETWDRKIRVWSGAGAEDAPDAGSDGCSAGWAGSRKSRIERPSGDWWAAEPRVGRVVYGAPGGVDRIRSMGDIQIPLQAAAAYLILCRSVRP